MYETVGCSMNVEALVNVVKPYLNSKNEIYEEDFDLLFSIFRKHEKYKIVDVLIKHNIDINYDKKLEVQKLNEHKKYIEEVLKKTVYPLMTLQKW